MGLRGEHSVYTFVTVKCLRSLWGRWVLFRFSTTFVSRKQLVIERNEMTFGLLIVYMILVNLNASCNSGVIRCISDFTNLVSRKRQILKQQQQQQQKKHTPRSQCYLDLCAHCLPSCQAQCQSPWASYLCSGI